MTRFCFHLKWILIYWPILTRDALIGPVPNITRVTLNLLGTQWNWASPHCRRQNCYRPCRHSPAVPELRSRAAQGRVAASRTGRMVRSWHTKENRTLSGDRLKTVPELGGWPPFQSPPPVWLGHVSWNAIKYILYMIIPREVDDVLDKNMISRRSSNGFNNFFAEPICCK